MPLKNIIRNSFGAGMATAQYIGENGWKLRAPYSEWKGPADSQPLFVTGPQGQGRPPPAKASTQIAGGHTSKFREKSAVEERLRNDMPAS